MQFTIPHVAAVSYASPYPFGMKDWGKRFRAHMKLHGLSQEALAEQIGRTQGAVGHWLRGRNQINLDEFWELCAAAGADPKLILFGTDDTKLVSEIRQALTAHPELIPRYRPFEKSLKRKAKKKKQARTTPA